MSLYQPFFNGKIGVVDLTTRSVYTLDLPWEVCGEHIGGATLNARLLSEYESDTLVLGTGPLTGSFAPASSLLVGTFRSPRWDHLCHVPFMLRSGPEMKFSGFDFLVIRGSAKEPCAVSAGRGQLRVHPVPDTADKPVPEVLQALKRAAPGYRGSIVTGPAADRGSNHASASVGSHGSFDRVGFAARMAEFEQMQPQQGPEDFSGFGETDSSDFGEPGTNEAEEESVPAEAPAESPAE